MPTKLAHVSRISAMWQHGRFISMYSFHRMRNRVHARRRICFMHRSDYCKLRYDNSWSTEYYLVGSINVIQNIWIWKTYCHCYVYHKYKNIFFITHQWYYALRCNNVLFVSILSVVYKFQYREKFQLNLWP